MPAKPKGSPEKRKNGKKQTKKNPRAAGRAEKVIDWETIDKLCHIQCTVEEICGFINVDDQTLERHCKKTHGIKFSHYLAQKRKAAKLPFEDGNG